MTLPSIPRISLCLATAAMGVAQTFALLDTKELSEQKVKVEAAEYKGRKAIRLTKETEEDGFALLKGTDFQDGTIEADLALKVTARAGRMPGFIGIAFRARPDASHYELFYLRPGNSQSNDQAMRNHSVQYCEAPDFTWFKLRREWPAIYESYAELEPETRTKLKIEVKGRSAKLYLNGSARPSLVVDGLKGEDLRGAVALWGYPGEESYFSNVRITNETAEPVKNVSDAAGDWNVRLATDAGTLEGSLSLSRTSTKLTGTWSGGLGDKLPVTGTWRDGYVEVSFVGEWPKDSPPGAPGTVTTTLAGWIDGPSGKGRMKIAGHADGQWVATRPQ
jgi:hypothetical protein